MTNRLVEEVIWDTRKAIPLKEFDASSKTPCIVQLAESKESRKRTLPTELCNGQELLLHSFIDHKRVICRCIDLQEKPSQKSRFSIPFGYDGLLEVLSESGEATRPLTSIAEIAEKAVGQFLSRSRVQCLSNITDSASVQTLEKGTVLVVKGTARVTSKHVTESYLHCQDKNDSYLYLNYKTEGIFSQFAERNSVSGVHTIQSLLRSFRLPCTVRVASGKIPRQACDVDMPGVFRLLELRRERTAILSPLSAKQVIVPVPVKTGLNVFQPANTTELRKHYIFNQVADACTSRLLQYLTRMQMVVSIKHRTCPPADRCSGDDNSLFEDVDEIYPYVRRGGTPPRMLRAQSLDCETVVAGARTIMYNRSNSQPVIGSREKLTLVTPHLVKQHTISSTPTETMFQFKSSSDSMTFAKANVLKEFIDKYKSQNSVKCDHEVRMESSDEDIYFTLEDENPGELSSIKDILLVEGVVFGHRA
ncbi:uncharacterized protein [Watersipora subatra]|uniref:uncharacterized protein n=1 Tax=Watersipora subatra TaxID=2589382 RepID=UPI00355BAD19